MNVSHLRNSLLAIVAAGAALCPTHIWAQSLNYHVDINTSALIPAAASGPFYLDFQLNGDGLPASATNTVSLSSFTFTLGGASGSATTYEGATGNLTSGVILTLSGTNDLNELYQGFSGTTTDIQFNMSSSTNGSGITADSFLVTILNGALNPIATNAPDTVSLLTEAINGATTASSLRTYQSTTPAGVTVSAVPEPSSWVAVIAGLGVLAGLLRRGPASMCAAR